MDLSSNHPVVAIVGRPNVGKSTLFNRLTGGRKAIVHDEPGVTRDRIISKWSLDPSWVYLVDTGGFEGEQEKELLDEPVRQQIQKAIADANVVLFLVDGRSGLIGGDEELAQLLRRQGKNVVLVINKCDPGKKGDSRSDFFSLGFSDVFVISAEHGLGIPELRDLLQNQLDIPREDRSRSSDLTRLSLVGRPNVGKSSILNALLGEDRANVSEVPGTTRDVVDTEIAFEGHPFRLIDTAGIRRRGKISDQIESRSAVKAIQSIQRSDVVVLILESLEALTGQDLRVASEVIDAKTGLLIAVNKMDLVDDTEEMRAKFRKALYQRAPFLEFAEFTFVSAKSGLGIGNLLKKARRIHRRLQREIPKEELRDLFRKIYEKFPPRGTTTYFLRLLSLERSKRHPSLFFISCNKPHRITSEYGRLWEKQLTRALDLEGVPVQIKFRKPIKRRKGVEEPQKAD